MACEGAKEPTIVAEPEFVLQANVFRIWGFSR
jgi:hypothetical protein